MKIKKGKIERKKVLFFLLDGLGSYQLESNEGFLLENRVSDIYTTFPSTTNVVLWSDKYIFVGLSPDDRKFWYSILSNLIIIFPLCY